MGAKQIKDRSHGLERMVVHAVQLLCDAQTIDDEDGPGRPGSYLLELTALEILLKAGILVNSDTGLPNTHDVLELYRGQTSELGDRVQAEFNAREAWHFSGERLDLCDQLRILGRNFVAYRYVYEASFPYSEEERRAGMETFMRGELPLKDADVVFCYPLLNILLSELLSDLKEFYPRQMPKLKWIEPAGPDTDAF